MRRSTGAPLSLQEAQPGLHFVPLPEIFSNMSTLNVNIPHQLSKEEAQERIKKLLTNLKEQQADKISDVKETWEGDHAAFSFSIKGFDISGGIKVNPDSVDIEGELPFALSFFKGMVADLISAKAKELLA